MPGRPWSRDETLVAFNVYCRTPFGRLHARNPEIIRVAGLLGRTSGALAMKCCNLAALDPSLQQRGIRGLAKVSHVDKLVWDEFERRPETVGFDSEVAVATLSHKQPRMVHSVDWEDIHGVDRNAVTRIRVNQHLFRSMVIAGYREACAVCGLPLVRLLVASHIVGWAIDPANRMNPRNGICLCALHDRAFDSGLLNVGDDYTISLARSLHRMPETEAVQSYFLTYEGRTIQLPDRWRPDPLLLKRHIELVGAAG